MSAAWHRFVEITAPRGGVVVAFAEIYIDETGTHDGSPVMGVAGYVFRKTKARQFTKEWNRHLRAKRLPYFHMTDCALGMAAYKDWSKDERIEHETALIRLVKDTNSFGFGVFCSDADYNETAAERQLRQASAYTFLLLTAINIACGHLIESGFKGRAAYIMEAGHRFQTQANTLISRLVRDFPDQYLRPNWAFVDKTDAPPLQAADLLAWLGRNTVMRTTSQPPRKDFVALTATGHDLSYFDSGLLKGAADVFEQSLIDKLKGPHLVQLPKTL